MENNEVENNVLVARVMRIVTARKQFILTRQTFSFLLAVAIIASNLIKTVPGFKIVKMYSKRVLSLVKLYKRKLCRLARLQHSTRRKGEKIQS